MVKKEKIILNEEDWKLLQELVSGEETIQGNLEEDAVIIEFELGKE